MENSIRTLHCTQSSEERELLTQHQHRLEMQHLVKTLMKKLHLYHQLGNYCSYEISKLGKKKKSQQANQKTMGNITFTCEAAVDKQIITGKK